MRYDVKVIINGVEVTDQASDSSPSITGVSYQNSVSEGPLQIGTAAVDKLTFTLLNPYKASFDGDKVEFWVNPDEDEEGIDRLSELEELIGDETDDEGIDEDDTDVYEDETEEDGEDLTDEELEESEAEEAELDAKVIEQVNGESTDNEEAESTDEAEEETWRLIGTFFVYKQKQTDTGIQLTCYDSMMFLHGSYTPDTTTDTVQNHYNAFRTACQEETGVPIDEMEFDDAYNKTITWDFTCSYRDALGYFAGLVGGYAHADADGEIGISFYLASDITLLSEELLSYTEESAGELVLDGVSCNRGRATNLTTDLIETGAGQAVSFTNPFVDESMLEDIFEMYRGMRYIGASLSCRWDESLQAGELIRIMSEAEYENWLRMNNAADATEDEANEKEIQLQMAQLGKMVLIGTQTIVFAGEAVSTIRSTSRAETAKENEMISPWKKSAMELADAAASAKTTAENAANAAGAAGTAAKQAYNEAQNAKKTATNYLSDLSNGVYVHAEGTTADPTASTAKGVRITDVVDVIRNGTSVAEFGNGTVTLGKHNTVNDNYMVLASDGLHFGCMEHEALAFLADIDNEISTFRNNGGIIFEDESENQQAVFDYMNGDFWFNGPVSTVGRFYQAGHSGTYGFIGARKDASLSSDKTIKTATGTAVCSISLEAGVWLALCNVRWSSNTSGIRRCNFATTSGSTEINYQIGACNGVCQIRWPTLVAPTATTTYYLNAYQNSGSSLTLPSTGNGVTAIRLV